jgi:Zn-dependent peptidase ImmA (M78 family)
VTKQAIEQIEQKALAVLQNASALTMPVDLVRAAESLDVKVHYEPLEDKVSGVLVIKSGERHALINGAHHSNRQRFSLAHELGHLVLHDGHGDRLFVDTNMRVYNRVGKSSDDSYTQPASSTTPEEEREANQFASALLMPRSLLEQASAQLDLSDETDVAFLARTFGVSDQAMSIRLQQLKFVQLDIAENP